MICPHCERSLLRKERPGNVCGHCHRRYALDPKTNDLALHDLRVRRTVQVLTENGRLPCTVGQLWYGLSRPALRRHRVETGCAVPLAVCGGIAAVIGLGSRSGTGLVVSGLLLLSALGFGVAALAGVGRGRPRMSREAFPSGPLREWRTVYGELPPGVIDDSTRPSSPGAPGPAGLTGQDDPTDRPVLVCPDPSVAVFLDASGLVDRLGLVLVTGPDVPPGRGPVLVLHDADVPGLRFVREVRAALPGRRGVDVGLPLRAVRGRRRAVAVRGPAPGGRRWNHSCGAGSSTATS